MRAKQYACTCGKQFTLEGWLKKHLQKYPSDPKHVTISDRPQPLMDAPVSLDIKVFVRVGNEDFTLTQFITLVNRMSAVRDALKHLGLD